MQEQNNDIILITLLSTIMLLFMLSFITAILFLYQKKNILYDKQLADAKNTYDTNLMQAQLEIQEQTFQNISREIHDNIGLSLTLAKLTLNTIELHDHSSTVKNIKSTVELITNSIADLKDISKSLNTEAIKDSGLYNTLKEETEKINGAGKYTVQFAAEGNILFMDAQKELILYRIAQEALNNILKHASATSITIMLSYGVDEVSLTIEDNGRGFDITGTDKNCLGGLHSGLKNMRTRATTINGVFFIKSKPGEGTKICVTTPY